MYEIAKGGGGGTMGRFKCVSHTKQSILLQSGASAFCLNSQAWTLAVITEATKI